MADVKDHLALITGGTGGIGAATCRALALLGCNIAIHYNSATQKAHALVEEVCAKGVKSECFQADLSNYDSVRNLHREVIEKMGNPVILFNNGTSFGSNSVSVRAVLSLEAISSISCNIYYSI